MTAFEKMWHEIIVATLTVCFNDNAKIDINYLNTNVLFNKIIRCSSFFSKNEFSFCFIYIKGAILPLSTNFLARRVCKMNNYKNLVCGY